MTELEKCFNYYLPDRIVADSNHGETTYDDYKTKVEHGLQALNEYAVTNDEWYIYLRDLASKRFEAMDRLLKAFLDNPQEMCIFNSTNDANEVAMIMSLDVKKYMLDKALDCAAAKYMYSTKAQSDANAQYADLDDSSINQEDPSEYTPKTQHTKKRRPNLPSNAKSVLSEWFLSHVDHPYPTQSEKQDLSNKTMLSLQKVDNWFINERSRKWDSYRRR